MMSPRVYDVAAIVGLHINRDEIPFLHDLLRNDLSFQVNKKYSTYSTFITTFNKGSGSVDDTKYIGFLLF